MPSNAFLLDATSRHMLHLQRLAGGNVKDILPLLNDMRDRLVSRIARDELSLADAGRMRILLGDLSEMIEGMESQLGVTINDQVRSLAEYEAGFTERMLAQASSVSIQGVSAEAVAAAVTDRPMTLLRGKAQQQLTIDQAVQRFARGVNRDVTTAIQQGIIAGEPTDRIARNIQGMVNNRSRAQAEAVVRTATNHAANVAREELYRQNADVVAGERFVAVMDRRTSDHCFPLSEQIFPIGEGPMPPIHWGAIAGGEMVKTKGGDKPIEQVAVGDLVLTHRGRWRPVSAVMAKRCETGTIRIMRNDAGGVVRMTDDHPVLVSGKGWVRADELEVGDEVFQHASKGRPVSHGSPVIEGAPNHYPSMFDSGEVFSKVRVEPSVVAASIDLDDDFVVDEGKVSDSVKVHQLPSPSRYFRSLKVFGKHALAQPVASFLVLRHRLKVFWENLLPPDGVVFPHCLGSSRVMLARIFGEPPCPVVLTTPDASGNVPVGDDACYLRLGEGFNAMLPTPSAHGAVGKAKFPFDLSEGLEPIPVVGGDEFSANGRVGEVGANHWVVSTVNDITSVGHDGGVYNLEVEDDNTYLVDGVVVHNCRSTRIVELRDEFQTDIDGTGRRTVAGPIGAQKTFGGWLHDQPASFQREFFDKFENGEEKYLLFSQGGLNYQQYADARGAAYTLEELRRLEPQAFERAGLDTPA